jgi:hypothetical protein
MATLSHSVRAAHAQFVIEQVKDETWKRAQFEQLINQYLINGEK